MESVHSMRPLGMNKNSTTEEKFQVYFRCRVLSKEIFRGVYEKLVEHLFVVIFHMIFEINPLCMTDQLNESFLNILNSFVAFESTYMMLFGCHISPHIMLQYVTTRWSCKKTQISWTRDCQECFIGGINPLGLSFC